MTSTPTSTAGTQRLGAGTIAFAIAAAIAAIGLPYTIWQVFYGTPLEEQLFFNQKIFYYHVPHAMLMFATVFVCGIASFGYLRNRKGSWDDVALAGGEPALSPALARKLMRELAKPAGSREDPDALTERELDVLRCLVEGVTSNRKLAHRLGVSENTVKFHVRNILDKLHLHNRAQVVAFALRHRIVDPTKT